MSTMQKEVAPAKSTARLNLTALLLSVAGGGVDAIMILAFQVLTGAQTGNTVLLAVAFAERRFTAGFYSAVSVAAFVIGSVAGQLVMIKRKSESALCPVGWALVAEVIPLGALALCWHFAQNNLDPKMTSVIVALAACTMGIQSAAVLRLGGTPTTTYVTGTLTTFSTELTRSLFLWEAVARSVPPRDRMSSSVSSSRRRVLYGIDWLVYLCGAIASALLFLSVREIALVLPFLAIVAAVFAGGASQFNGPE